MTDVQIFHAQKLTKLYSSGKIEVTTGRMIAYVVALLHE
jgi:hypothetical protein